MKELISLASSRFQTRACPLKLLFSYKQVYEEGEQYFCHVLKRIRGVSPINGKIPPSPNTTISWFNVPLARLCDAIGVNSISVATTGEMRLVT